MYVIVDMVVPIVLGRQDNPFPPPLSPEWKEGRQKLAFRPPLYRRTGRAGQGPKRVGEGAGVTTQEGRLQVGRAEDSSAALRQSLEDMVAQL
jgi:hypothetical protein